MSAIFISYRRSDSLSATGRLADELCRRFGAAQLFRDLEALEAGVDFERTILDALRAATVVLVVIGRAWVDMRDAEGARRLDNPQDFVRREVETALKAHKPIIPILTEGASIPRADDLPPTLRKLIAYQAVELSEGRHWAYDVGQLASQVERLGINRVEDPTPKGWAVSLLNAARDFVPDLLLLLARPKTLLARRNVGRPQDLIRGLEFLMLSTILSYGLVLCAWPIRDVSLVGFLGLCAFIGSFATLVLSVPLYFAWWVVGARSAYRRVATPLCYESGVVTLGVFAGFLILMAPVLLTDPQFLEHYRQIFDVPGDSAEKVADASTFVMSAITSSRGGFLGAFLMIVVHAMLWTWLVIAWGAYRQSLALSRARSFAAFVVFGALMIGIGVGAMALASARTGV